MAALDDINRKYGKHSLRYASEIKKHVWQMRQQFKSPSYTTRLDQLWVVDATAVPFARRLQQEWS